MNHKPVRLRDVALAAGTSTKTASRVVNGDARVSESTRTRVEQAVKELGYQVDVTARSLRRGVDDTIGVVVPTIGDPFFAQGLEMIEEMALAMGVNLLVASNSRSASHERELVEGLIGRRVAGLIIAPGQADYSFLTTMPTPVVFMDRHPLGSASGVVRVDDRGGAKAAVAHLIAHGHRRIALVTDDPNIKTSALRRQGYHDALTDAGIVVDPNLEAIGCEVSDQAFTATERLLGVANPPTAIFSARSETSLGVIRALHNEQREDIAFISFGDFEMADVLRPAITVIDHDPRQLAEAAMIRLRQAMEHKQVDHTDTIVPLRLITRGSGELRPGREVMSA